jgi:hypothetical protein
MNKATQATKIPERPSTPITHPRKMVPAISAFVARSRNSQPWFTKECGHEGLWQGNPRRRHNPRHAQNLQVLDIGNRGDQQPHILEHFYFLKRGIRP